MQRRTDPDVVPARRAQCTGSTATRLDMIRDMRVLALLVWVISSCLGSATENSKELSALEKQFEAARAELARAEEQLIAAYDRAEAEFARLAHDAEARGPLAASWAEGVRAAAPRFVDRLTGKKTGKTPSQPAQTAIAAEWLAAALSSTSLEVGFHAPLANAAAESARPLLAGDLAGAELDARLASALADYFVSGSEFAEVWNSGVFPGVVEAGAYAKAFANYREIGVKVDRARSPEKFDDSGQRLPPGMVLVKGGSYDSGPDQGFVRKGLDKRAARVTVKPFFLDRTEVTNADYFEFVRGLPAERRRAHLPSTWTMKDDGTVVPPPGKDDHPVAGVSWNDAFEYATSIGKRLPTEEEWEAAARGPKALRFPWGANFEASRANTRDSGRNDTAPVGSFPDGASPFGALDLCGNVEEWTASTMDGDVVEAPLQSSLVQMVIRGGNFHSNQDGAATTFRWYSPGLSTKKATLGFRCAMSVPK